MSDHWAELRTFFDELVELDDAAREVRLREIGSRDPALRARLEAMLAADAEAESPSRDYEEVVRRSVRPAMGPRAEADPLGLLGTTVGRYHIDAFVGAGGMGVVYRATDRRLGRVAALKVLPPVWSLDERAKERFLHEARAASSLDDRNICTIYEADETAGGMPYIAMAFYEGETLQTRLERGPLAVGEALELASQAAQGLTAAHARGLVHRDIKPANLLVTTDGALKILDFGIAKAADIGLTLTGQRPGTAAYMAPEQARGDEVDGRADLWSLGVVLYEMLTGARPAAAGPTSEPAPMPSARRADVPTWVDALALQLIAHDPLERPQRAEDLLSALARRTTETPTGLAATDAATASARVPRRRGQAGAGSIPHGATAARARTVANASVGALIALIGIGAYVYLQDGSAPAPPPEGAVTATRFLAVLPFENRSPDAENEYFADGVTDDVLAHLAQVPDLSVISRTTTMGYKGSTKRIPEIAEELGVDYVLDGSVQLEEAQVRITAQLVDGSTDQYLWVETYDRRLEDIFAVQTEIARSIVEALEVELSGSVAARIQRRPTEDLEAYDLFLLGRENHYRYDLQGNQRAMDLFRSALERDPEFALARAWRARALVVYAVNLGMGANWADSAVAEARQAVQAQPDVADAHTALGAALSFSGQYEQAIAALEQALALNPNDWAAARYLGVTYTKIGAWDEAIRVTRRALELQGVRLISPLHPNLAWYALQLGLLDRAGAAVARALTLQPDDPTTVANQAWIELWSGERDAALLTTERVAGFASEAPSAGQRAAQLFIWLGAPERAREAAEAAYTQAPTAYAYHESHLLGVLYAYALEHTGERGRSRELLAETERHALARIAEGDELNALRYSLAAVHAMRGEHDEAFHWLDEAMRFGWNVAGTTASDPLLENLRGDERFQAALNRMERELAPMRARIEREWP